MAFGLFRKIKKTGKKKGVTKGKTVKKQRQLKPKRKGARAKKAQPATTPKVKKAVLEPELIGKITHYFPHVKAGVIEISAGEVSVGDTLHIKGHTTNFKQKIASMQINHVPIKSAKKGDEIGLLVKRRVRGGDTVYKI